MEIFLTGILFQTSILFYVLAAVISLILIRKQRAGNIISNIFCILASILGAITSIIHIVSGNVQMNINILKSVIPLISLDLKMDNLSAFFVLALSILVFCVSIYSIGYSSHYLGKRNVAILNLLYSTFILSMILVMTSANIVFFYISWEAMSLLSYFLVVFESDRKENLRAGTLYIIMTHVATAFLLIGFMLIYCYTHSFDIFGSSAAIPDFAKNIIFIMFMIGFGTKAGVIPFHIWLPYAHPAAPSNVSSLMSGIMIKTAIYGLIRFVLCYLGIQSTWWGVLILCIGVISAVFGVAYAVMERDIKKLLAFSSVENIGIILIGLGVSFIAFAQNNPLLGVLALTASLLHTFNHVLFKGGLFLGAGAIHYSTHTKDMEKLGGLIKTMPFTSLFVLTFSLAISAIVPLNGFVGEWLTYQSLFANILSGQGTLNILSIIAVAALGLAGALAVACFVKLFGVSFLGLPRSAHSSKAKDVPVTMNIGMGILAALCLIVGLFPLTVLKLIDGVVFSLAGKSVLEQLQGGFLIVSSYLNISGVISPAMLAVAIAGIIFFTLLVIRIIGGKYIERKYGTWDCGFEALNARMQYSATGYSKPIGIVFRLLLRPSRKIQVTGELEYHPESIEYIVSTESIFEKYIYAPIYKKMQKISRKTKFTIQTGKIHNYILYIFIMVLALMIYNRFV